MSKPRIALALGGGGLRGIAHIGVLRALAEAEIQPTVYAGSSAGALVAAAAAYDLSLSEMERIAARLHRKSLFQIDVLGCSATGTGALSVDICGGLCSAKLTSRSVGRVEGVRVGRDALAQLSGRTVGSDLGCAC
jgi:hypothetical protein